MENQINVGDQNAQQVGQNPVNQPVQIPEKPKINNRLVWATVFGAPILTYILFQILGYPLSFVLIPILFRDISNAGLGGLAILMVTTILLAVIFGLICGLLVYLVTKKIKLLFVGFGIFMLIFAVHRTIIKISNEKYLTTEVNTALKNVNEVVGKEKLIFTYSNSAPIYNANSILDEVKITFKVVAPQTGDYLIDSYLATPYDLYGPKDQEVPRADTFNKMTIGLTEQVPFDLILPLKMKPFVDANYEGKLKLSFRVWRTNIQVKDVAWHKEPITSWPVNITDSGSSPNYIVSKDSGQEKPIYSVGPFSISRP